MKAIAKVVNVTNEYNKCYNKGAGESLIKL